MTMQVYKYEVIAAEIERNIASGLYKPGHRLPSIRTLKSKYGSSLSTVQSAYEYLIARGLVKSLPKSGYYVHLNTAKASEKFEVNLKPVVIRDAIFKNNLSLITVGRQKDHSLSAFNVAAPGDLLVPQKLLLRTMQEVIREKGTALLRYYPANGLELLKELIAKRAALYNTNLAADNMIITDGALQGLYIALAAVTNPGDVIAVESPCIFSVLEVIRVLKLKVVDIPVLPNHGFDVDRLKTAVKQTDIRAIVLTPNFHNPTGTVISDEGKQAVLAIAESRQIPIVENDVYGDLHFFGNRPSNIKSWDSSGLVLTYSSFSKTLAPGIRLGWLSAGKFFKEAEQIKFSLGSSVSPIYQETLCKLLASSSYEKHLRKLRKQLMLQCGQTLSLLKASFPDKMQVSVPKGGYSVWVKMEQAIAMDRFYNACEKVGVRFTPGYTFSFTSEFDQYFRIVFADPYTAQREEALKNIGVVAKILTAG